MFRACTNQSCPSRYTVHQFLYCSSCSLPTQAHSDQGAFFPSPPESQLLDSQYQQQPQISSSPHTPQHLFAPQQARKLPATLNQPGAPPQVGFGRLALPTPSSNKKPCKIILTNKPVALLLTRLQGSMTWMTPPLSSKSLTPGSHMPTPSSIQEFNFYNPKCEKKARDRLRRTCVSCYNRNDRKVASARCTLFACLHGGIQCNRDVESCDYCLSKNIWCRAPIRTPKLFNLGA